MLDFGCPKEGKRFATRILLSTNMDLMLRKIVKKDRAARSKRQASYCRLPTSPCLQNVKYAVGTNNSTVEQLML